MSLPLRRFSHHWVCIPCMQNRRMMLTGYTPPSEVLCSGCHKPMRKIGSRDRIPVKDRKKWDDFEAYLDRNKKSFEELEIGAEYILERIGDTVEVLQVAKPVYNFKAGGE